VHDELANPKSEWVENVVDLDDLRAIETSENYRPMKLNEDILLKFGFEIKYDSNYWNSKLCIHNYYNEFYILQEQGRVFFEHVHQLQNLYFALTGEELTYTQP
jgi:hypothetical protein